MGQQVINGLFLGSIYALFALGYTLVFGVLDILNLAHAAVFMLATFVAVALVGHGLPILVALPAAVLFAGLISSLAAATIIEAVALEIWGPNITRFPFGTMPEGPANQFQLFGGTVSRLQLTIIAVAVLLFLALTWLVKGTRLGREVRAVAESPRAARILGVDVDRAIAAAFFISSALGGAAGVLYGLAFNSISPDMGRGVELKGLAVIILGGMGSMPGAVVAGFALGLIEVFVVANMGGSWRDVISFAGLFLFLVLRPRGLLGAAATREA